MECIIYRAGELVCAHIIDSDYENPLKKVSGGLEVVESYLTERGFYFKYNSHSDHVIAIWEKPND